MSELLIAKLKKLLPSCLTTTEPSIDWRGIESEFPELVRPLQKTLQDPQWHAEGDVWTHTQMTVDALTRLPAWRSLDEEARIRLFLAALLHDVGKPATSRVEDGRVVSPKHAAIGAQDARVFLWERLGLNTDPSLIRFREEVAALVRRHSTPLHLLERPDPLRRVVEFSMLDVNEELATLCEADVRGRRGDALDVSLENIEIFRLFAEENGVLNQAFPFASKRSAFGYFSERLDHPAEILYDDSWGEVVVLSGLPASGKDEYARRRLPELPVVSLDDWRKRLKIGWTEDQNAVAEAAHKEAVEYLRQKTPFVWNATFLRKDFRQAAVRLCVNYGARVRIVWLEASLEELRRRNSKREEPVADSAYDKLARRMEPPTCLEADEFEIAENNLKP